VDGRRDRGGIGCLRAKCRGARSRPSRLPYREALEGFKKKLIQSTLDRAGGNQTRAAEMLGVQRTYLNRLIKELEIER